MLHKIYSKFLEAYDYYTDNYECGVAGPDEIGACLEIRKEVFGKELHRFHENQKLSVADNDPLDLRSIHVYCREKKAGKIIGCVRITQAKHLLLHPDYKETYRLHLFQESLIPRVTIVSRMAILKKFRGGPVGLLLACECYEYGLRFTETLLSIVVCEPNLYPMYRRLGYRPFDKVFASSFGGYRVPLVLVVHDYSYLRDLRSPFYDVAKKHQFKTYVEGIEWFHKRDSVEPGLTLLTSKTAQEEYPTITDGISEQGKLQLLHNSAMVHCHYGDKIIKSGAKEKFFGFVKEGAIEVISNGKPISMLGEGDIFGEIAFVLDVPMHADLIAAQSDTKIVLVSLSSIRKLKNMQDQLIIWQNLSKILAIRLTQQVWISSAHPD